jgi:AcrR family transcriptional regulator
MTTAGGRRADILEAAAHVVEAAGSRHLTIDAVAQQAGFSKGGVLYHFPSKRALLQGMLERLLEQIEGRTETLLDSLGDGPNARLRARILAERHQSAGERAMARSILAAAAEDPDLLAPARQAVENAFADAADAGEPDTLGWVALLATEGLRFLEMLNLLPLSGNERERVHDQLLRLVETGRP